MIDTKNWRVVEDIGMVGGRKQEKGKGPKNHRKKKKDEEEKGE